MSLRMGMRPLFACTALLALAQTAPAQSKVGVVNLQAAVFGSAEIKKADADMQAKYKSRDQELEELNKQRAAAQQKLNSTAQITPQQETDLQSQIARLDRDIQRKTEDLQADSERDRNEILGKSSSKMAEVVRKLAAERGFDVVVEANTTYYFKDALDLTKDAIAAYDKAYPVAAAPAPAPAKPAGK